ncbi:hypothetical protein HMPREF1548_04136 [Clostridium sp. KLE 1755]|nr:hypothetical protein HMPREF1548_04136 [Clostridium sp. KLE 1755]
MEYEENKFILWRVKMTPYLRQILILGILIYFVLILIFLKNKALSLKYTLLWILAGIIMACMVFWPNALLMLSRLTGIETQMYALFVLIIFFVLCILMSLTSIVSKQSAKIKKMIQFNALLEKRIRELENSKYRQD